MMALGAGTVSASQKQVWDFSHEFPQGTVTEDADGLDPSPDTSRFQFQKGDAWKVSYVDSQDGFVAISTSWYSPKGKSNDWLILPPVTVREATAVLNWRARAWDKRYSDGYKVYVAPASATSAEDFASLTPVAEVPAENSAWTWHSVSLEAYQGQQIRVAFLNDSDNCAFLLLDDVMVGTPEPATLTLTTHAIAKPGDPIAITGTVSSDLTQGATGLRVGYDFASRSGELSLEGQSVKLGESIPFAFNALQLDYSSGQRLEGNVWVEANGVRSTMPLTVTGTPNTMVMEECTGMWCMYCVRGIVVMRNMYKAHPEAFVGIALHSGDDMFNDDGYSPYIFSMGDGAGYPFAIFNRDPAYKADMGLAEEYFQAISRAPLRARVDLEVILCGNEYTLTGKVVTTELCEGGRYRLAYVFLENDVWKEGYYQKNAYASGQDASGIDMEEFNTLPPVIVDYHFNDVARGYVLDKEGIEGSLPEVLLPGREYRHEVTVPLPDNILNPENVEIAALLLDTTDHRIVNATKVSLAQQTQGIGNLVTDPESPASVEIYSMQGLRYPSLESAPAGMYIIRTVTDGKVKVAKILK